MRSTFRIIAVSIVLISCDKESNNPGVEVNFFNQTGNAIEDLTIGDRYIGQLNSGESTDVILFEEFGFDTGMPDEVSIGTINNDFIESFNSLYWCGTEKTSVAEGKYEMNINLVDTDTVDYFRLDLK